MVEETAGAYERPQCSACFIQSVERRPHEHLRAHEERGAPLQVRLGHRLELQLDPRRQEKLSGGGTSSGLMSFLEVFDRAAGATKSGGTTRRAAKMVCLDMDHDPRSSTSSTGRCAKERKKAHALIAAGYPSDFNGEAYHTISGQEFEQLASASPTSS